MKFKLWFNLVLMLFLFALIFSCADEITKASQSGKSIRIEYSDCVGCKKCVDDFSCPTGAIGFDETRGRAVIDPEKCIRCMQCYNLDICDFDGSAFRSDEDKIAPRQIFSVTAESDSTGRVKIRFPATGDDDSLGTPFSYEVVFNNLTNNEISPLKFYEIPRKRFGVNENFVYENLLPENEYNLSIIAIDEAGNKSPKIETTVVTMGEIEVDEIAPNQITTLSAIAISNNAYLTWKAVGDDGNEGIATGYEIRYSTEIISESNWENCIDANVDMVPQSYNSDESTLIAGLDFGTTYYFGIKAFDEAGNYSPLSNIVEMTTPEPPDNIPPAQVTDLSAQINENNFILSFTAVGDDGYDGQASSYDLRWSYANINEDNFLEATPVENLSAPSVSGTQENIVFENPTPNQEYFFALKVFDDKDNSSSLSNVVSVVMVVETDDIAPADITDLGIITNDNNNFVLNWTAVGDDNLDGTVNSYIMKYALEEITSENFASQNNVPNMISPSVSGTLEEYIFKNPVPNQVYYFAIKAVDDFGNSSNISNVVSQMIVVEEDNTAPATINDLHVVAESSNLGQIKISFTCVGGDANIGTADHYEIRYNTSSIDELNWNNSTLIDNIPAPFTAGESQTITLYNIPNGELIYFAVKVYDENDNVSEISNIAIGKIVYQINQSQCIDCFRCIGACDTGAISDAGNHKEIDPDLCVACGDCWCPFGAIHIETIAYSKMR